MTDRLTACQNVCQDFEWIGSLASILANLAIVVGVLVAWYQLDSWKRERLTTKKAELGEELISLISELVERFAAIRSPFGYGAPDGEVDDGTYDFTRRLKELAELDDDFARLRALRVRLRAYFDKPQLLDSVDSVFEARTQLILGLKGLIRLARLETKRGVRYTEKEFERRAKYEILVWDSYSDAEDAPDPIRKLLEPALKNVEAEMIPIVRMRTYMK